MARRVLSKAARAGLGLGWTNGARGVGRGGVLEGVEEAQAGGRGQWSCQGGRPGSARHRRRVVWVVGGGGGVDLWALGRARRRRGQGLLQPGASSGSRAGLSTRRGSGGAGAGAGWDVAGTRAVVLVRRALRACDAAKTPRDLETQAGLCCSGG